MTRIFLTLILMLNDKKVRFGLIISVCELPSGRVYDAICGTDEKRWRHAFPPSGPLKPGFR